MPQEFDIVREKLESQYSDIQFDKDSGWSKHELDSAFETYLRENPSESPIIIRAWLFKLVCEKSRLAVDVDDYFVDKFEHHNMMVTLFYKWLHAERLKEFDGKQTHEPGLFAARLDNYHTCPDWNNIFKYGIKGLRNRAADKSGDFYKAVTMVYDGVLTLLGRFNEKAQSDVLSSLIDGPPKTFHQALQLSLIYNELQEFDGEYIRSMGRFDLLMNDFYINDMESGRITRQRAKELLKYYFIKFHAKGQGKTAGKPFLFGPQTNEFTDLVFEAYKEMNVIDPKFHIRISANSDRKFVENVVDCIQHGCTSMVLLNNDAQIDMLCEYGKQREDAENYIILGCYELAVMGKEIHWPVGGGINLAKIVELLMQSPGYESFDDMMQCFMAKFDEVFSKVADFSRRLESIWERVSPAPLFSGTMDSCIEKGLDVSQGGAEYYTNGCMCHGLTNAVDSLMVIKQLIFDEKSCSFDELKQALDANWVGYDELRQIVRTRVPKWGNNINEVDSIAVEITDHISATINREENYFGGKFEAGLSTIIVHAEEFAEGLGALPDGHLAGQWLTMNISPTAGMDRNGVTSLINSATKINFDRFPSHSVLDLMLHPTSAAGKTGNDAIITLIDSFFQKGGMSIQFNIFDADTLRDAQRNPENYAGLQVRLCGWNVFFCDLSPEVQDLFITKSGVA